VSDPFLASSLGCSEQQIDPLRAAEHLKRQVVHRGAMERPPWWESRVNDSFFDLFEALLRHADRLNPD